MKHLDWNDAFERQWEGFVHFRGVVTTGWWVMALMLVSCAGAKNTTLSSEGRATNSEPTVIRDERPSAEETGGSMESAFQRQFEQKRWDRLLKDFDDADVVIPNALAGPETRDAAVSCARQIKDARDVAERCPVGSGVLRAAALSAVAMTAISGGIQSSVENTSAKRHWGYATITSAALAALFEGVDLVVDCREKRPTAELLAAERTARLMNASKLMVCYRQKQQMWRAVSGVIADSELADAAKNKIRERISARLSARNFDLIQEEANGSEPVKAVVAKEYPMALSACAPVPDNNGTGREGRTGPASSGLEEALSSDLFMALDQLTLCQNVRIVAEPRSSSGVGTGTGASN
ncbi:hypothetical protein [Corallococcus silvisoli]|uniref:hypothetical protein n=1 Tax=Corallococcus silvisoli TaxID=2697031 RepID=UPI001377648B|nr:hypothetical protein [Corallococcus silvisoli]NBD13860.1 hypothetical protein [Corallococcus silvisoli]